MYRPIFCTFLLVGIFFKEISAGIPAPEQFFSEQIVDHLDTGSESNERDYHGRTWTQRYYTWDREFKGPGSPIFVIMGGEGGIEPTTGLYYPFVTHHLAKIFGGYVLEPEHRFYGKSQPIDDVNTTGSEDPRVHLFTSEQALHDYMYLVQVEQDRLGCSKDRFSPNYCPVMTIGGSYPGWLAAMARIVFPNIVDMAYSASAPMKFYSQEVDQYAYYDLISEVAEDTVEGCSAAVREALIEVKDSILQGRYNEESLGICRGSTPAYIDPSDPRNLKMLVDELMMVVEYTFANANMGNYPPSNTTRLYWACQSFTNDNWNAFQKVRDFLTFNLPPGGEDENCWNMKDQLPSGHDATITSGDWSGVGTGDNGESWDWQTCTLLVEAIGLSTFSMFPPRDWSLEWLNDHCQQRFGVKPQPYNLVRRWKFDKLVENDVSRIIFTNGLKDGWSVGAVKESLSENLIAINFPNGAHHSDLSGQGPTTEDTDDIKQGFQDIIEIVGAWLDEVWHQTSKLN